MAHLNSLLLKLRVTLCRFSTSLFGRMRKLGTLQKIVPFRLLFLSRAFHRNHSLCFGALLWVGFVRKSLNTGAAAADRARDESGSIFTHDTIAILRFRGSKQLLLALTPGNQIGSCSSEASSVSLKWMRHFSEKISPRAASKTRHSATQKLEDASPSSNE